MNKKSFMLCALLGASLSAFADGDKETMFNPVTTGVTSQSIAPDARGGGMGDIGAATEADVNSQFWSGHQLYSVVAPAGQ